MMQLNICMLTSDVSYRLFYTKQKTTKELIYENLHFTFMLPAKTELQEIGDLYKKKPTLSCLPAGRLRAGLRITIKDIPYL